MSAKKTILRWYHQVPQDPEDWDEEITKIQRKFKKYKLSIYLLNRNCLKIQHAFFNSLMKKQNDVVEFLVTEQYSKQKEKQKNTPVQQRSSRKMLTSRKDRYDINSIESQSRKLISLLKSDQDSSDARERLESSPSFKNLNKIQIICKPEQIEEITKKTYTPNSRRKELGYSEGNRFTKELETKMIAQIISNEDSLSIFKPLKADLQQNNNFKSPNSKLSNTEIDLNRIQRDLKVIKNKNQTISKAKESQDSRQSPSKTPRYGTIKVQKMLSQTKQKESPRHLRIGSK